MNSKTCTIILLSVVLFYILTLSVFSIAYLNLKSEVGDIIKFPLRVSKAFDNLFGNSKEGSESIMKMQNTAQQFNKTFNFSQNQSTTSRSYSSTSSKKSTSTNNQNSVFESEITQKKCTVFTYYDSTGAVTRCYSEDDYFQIQKLAKSYQILQEDVYELSKKVTTACKVEPVNSLACSNAVKLQTAKILEYKDLIAKINLILERSVPVN